MINSNAVVGAEETRTSASGIKTLVNKLSRIALGMADDIYGFNPERPNETEYEEIVADLKAAGISVSIESVRRSLTGQDDLYADLPEVRETLGRVVLGIAIRHFDYDPKSSRSATPKRIAEILMGLGSVDVDTIRERLKEAAARLGFA